ncbi:nuclear egress membrane protein [Rhinolophus gammaherpesvirus 1]|uniref:Nuclear egress membrane protein n=1 Tax=Rhinolophus gammaherpesvirus 1 TaxID=2054179 RepID=A0A2Z5U7F7_9GAMA|nr:nuclear egress membrane protein [Rhinolophus gammaherpesvirus 1]BBB06520.1 nuclear egress membrane protein [Rhinolophus gammaherpesvirus 1]
MNNSGRKLVAQLCQVVKSFLCQAGTVVDMWQCSVGPHVFSKGSTQPICIVKLVHGQIYNLEFVYRYWCHILKSERFPFSPVFIISNNGLAVTLKCFLCEPKEIRSQFGQSLDIDSDVYLSKNTCVVLSQDDFTKFKTNLVFSKDLSVYNSMVVCRTYLTDFRQALQFLVVKAKNPKRVSVILGMIAESLGLKTQNQEEGEETMYQRDLKENMVRRPIRCQDVAAGPHSRHQGDSKSIAGIHPHQKPPSDQRLWGQLITHRYLAALGMGALMMLVVWVFRIMA